MSAAHVILTPPARQGRTPRYVRVDLSDVRAANTLVIHYDLDRDGWVIESPTRMEWADGDDQLDERLEEVAFVPAFSAAASAELERIDG